MKTRKKIFVCSRLRGDYEKNLEVAKSLCRIVAINGDIPIAPHVYFTQFLIENNENERKLGIELGLQLLKECDELWAWVPDGPANLSEGMKQEIEFAVQNKITIRMIMPVKMIYEEIEPIKQNKVTVNDNFEYNEAGFEQKLGEFRG